MDGGGGGGVVVAEIMINSRKKRKEKRVNFQTIIINNEPTKEKQNWMETQKKIMMMTMMMTRKSLNSKNLIEPIYWSTINVFSSFFLLWWLFLWGKKIWMVFPKQKKRLRVQHRTKWPKRSRWPFISTTIEFVFRHTKSNEKKQQTMNFCWLFFNIFFCEKKLHTAKYLTKTNETNCFSFF